MNSILNALLASPSHLSLIAIAIVGLVLAHTRLKRLHPKAYIYGTVGLALLLANGFLGVATVAVIQANARDFGNGAAVANILTKFNLASFIVLTSSLVLILVALLADRRSAENSRVAA
jgi:hypothetical protein